MTDQLRETLTNAGRVLVSEDQGDYVAGHITVRLPNDTQRFLMKPAGIGLDEMSPAPCRVTTSSSSIPRCCARDPPSIR